MYTKYQFEEQRGQSVGKWHPYGAFCRGLPFVFALININWQHLPFAASLFGFLFAIGVNKIALKVGFFHVGQTAKFDKVLGKYQWLIFIVAMAASLILIII